MRAKKLHGMAKSVKKPVKRHNDLPGRAHIEQMEGWGEGGLNSEHSDKGYLLDLCRALSSLKGVDEIIRFLNDLCTPKELEEMAGRWRVARLLKDRLSYREIYEQTGVSTATVTRVARSLQRGMSGYETAIQRIGKK